MVQSHGPAAGPTTVRGTIAVAGDEPRPGTIVVERAQISARSDDGLASMRWNLADTCVDLGGFDGNIVYLRDRNAPGSCFSPDPALAAALRAVGSDVLAGELAKFAKQTRTAGVMRWLGIGAALLFVALVIGFLWSVPKILAASVDQLPIEIDKSIGDGAISESELGGPILDDPILEGFVREVVDRLEPHAKVKGFDYRITVVDSPVVNAFALPGGRIVVFTGLIRAADAPEQVAGVLAHEISHVTLRHGLRNVAHGAGTWVAVGLLFGDMTGWAALAGNAAAIANNNFYSQTQEAAADAEGVRMMMAAGLEPDGLAQFFQTLKDQPGSELPGALNWLSTHPDHDSRIEHVRRLASELPTGEVEPLRSDWAAVKRAAGED